ncbi:MAG TPA: anti-sigma regulatory factor [Blastocatellia bacterium]|nr:anti-sigma regulatory factor [Blastocatellia bacterium]
MPEEQARSIKIEDHNDLVIVRACVRDAAIEMGFSHIDQVRLVTAASELARNITRYTEGGRAEISRVREPGRRGLRIRFEDRGKGIADIALAMTDGYSTSRGLGKGLPGARRLVDDFKIESEMGKGTIVTITKWL